MTGSRITHGGNRVENDRDKKIIEPSNYMVYVKRLERIARKAGVANILGLLSLTRDYYTMVRYGQSLLGYKVIKECYVSIDVTRNDIEVFNYNNYNRFFKESQIPWSKTEFAFNKINENCQKRLLSYARRCVIEKTPLSSLVIQHIKDHDFDYYDDYMKSVGFSKEEIEEFQVIERGATFS